MDGTATEEVITAQVTRTADLTPRIKLFELAAGAGATLPAFGAGDHLDIIRADGLKRSYSLCNDPQERHRYVLAVLREEQGVFSQWMHGQVAAGTSLAISAPKNAFKIDEMGDHHTLIAGGVGITPIKAVAHRLVALGKTFTLHYCTRDAGDTAFLDELQALAGAQLVLHHDGGDPAQGLDVQGLLKTRPPGGHVYVCGPKGLITAVREAAGHWPKGTVHFEIFASPGQLAEEEGDMPFEIELRKSGLVVQVPAGQSALDAILEAGHDAPFVCKEGWCGNCQCDLLEGDADHRDEVLSPAEQEAQTQIHICVSRAAKGVSRLVIDR